MDYYSEDISKIYNEFKSSENGLNSNQINSKIQKFGPNKLIKKRDFKTLKLLLSQFKSPLVILLIFAGAISYYLNELIDAYVIFLVVILNALLGFFQEYRAEKP